MADRFDDQAEDKPLDPAVERIQARLRRLILVSGTTLGVGILAVMFAVIWRVSHLDDRRAASGEPWSSVAELPAGAEILSTGVDGDRLVVTTQGAGGRAVHVFDLVSGRRLGTTTLVAR